MLTPIVESMIDSLLTPIVESTYLNRDMCKFESSQKDESRRQSTDSSKAYRNTSAFKCLITHLRSSIGNERMTRLALLSTHKDRQIDREKIMNDFVASSNRSSDFVL